MPRRTANFVTKNTITKSVLPEGGSLSDGTNFEAAYASYTLGRIIGGGGLLDYQLFNKTAFIQGLQRQIAAYRLSI